MTETLTRRDLLKTSGLVAGAVALSGCAGLGLAAGKAEAAGGGAGAYELPPLPYAYDALEPHMDSKTLTIHHDRHHAGYVKGLNAAMDKLASARAANDTSKAKTLALAVAFHGSGHKLHSVFWPSMKPEGGGRPSGELARLIDRDFASFGAFREEFATVTKSVPGSGWGVLAWEPMGRRLIVQGIEKHENVFLVGAIPIMVCDVWEHAYYLKYQNDRGKFVDAFLDHLVDWSSTAERLKAAMAA
jgi:Fe-Mn family superoxide dismutase